MDEGGSTSGRGVRWGGAASGILVATVVSGGAGYLVTALAARVLSVAEYAQFAVFWSVLYAVVGGLGGVQQEVTRASAVRAATPRTRPIAPFAIAMALLVGAVVGLGMLIGAPALFGERAGAFAVPVVVGATAYVLVATVSGALYGAQRWRLIAVLIAADGLARLAVVVVLLLLGAPAATWAWAVVVPFPLVLVAVARPVRRALAGRVFLDAPYPAIARGAGAAVCGAAATGLLVSGLPFLVRASSPELAPAALAPLLLALTLVRAPLVVPFLAVHSLLITRFRGVTRGLARTVAGACAVVIALCAVLGLLASLVGPWLLTTVFGPTFRLDAPLLFALVATAGLVGALVVTGSVVLARAQHLGYALGWVVAAITTVAVLLTPIALDARLALALAAGPVAGLLVHVGSLAVGARRRTLSSDRSESEKGNER
ncbi:hypothetical protein QT381_08040 [Galbitalea sp. SE-J8]|uniref:hypothetical protein n=1 Tax=Galbitalea sp. SE-J8 TaxID=3054952 RepID=UPI00259CF19D|nr:hypothetical protein [Galbitalea sp. SE-J8]MDM4762955.1 hypothetical protein [Galbitalea sp. SE-J8]